MQSEKTITEETILEHVQTSDILRFELHPQDLNVSVYFYNITTNKKEKLIADMSQEWGNMTQTKKDNWNAMFAKIVAQAKGVTVGEVTGNLWD
jgi:hypothetical protein